MKKSSPSKLLQDSSFFRECLAEREAISRHQRRIGRKAGHEVSFEEALVDWALKRRSKWIASRRNDS